MESFGILLVESFGIFWDSTILGFPSPGFVQLVYTKNLLNDDLKDQKPQNFESFNVGTLHACHDITDRILNNGQRIRY